MDREAWWAMVFRVAKSQTLLKQLKGTHLAAPPRLLLSILPSPCGDGVIILCPFL